MSSVILYLFETSVVLTVLYGFYILLLKKLTFFNFNRYFLLGIFTLSFIVPLSKFDLSSWKAEVINEPLERLGEIRILYYGAIEQSSNEGLINTINDNKLATNPSLAKEDTMKKDLVISIFLIIYCIGLIAIFFRCIGTFFWIMKLKLSNPQVIIQGVNVVKVPIKVAPFSFMNYAFIQEASIGSNEINQILAHEKIHIEQRHSFDLLFVQALAAFLWFNPIVWTLIKSLKTTHEYIADNEIIGGGFSLVEYQTLLLKQLINNNNHGLVHHFNLSFIKKRIAMMKMKESGWAGKLKVMITLFTIVVFSLVIIQCNSIIDDKLTAPIITKENVKPISEPVKSISITPAQDTAIPGRKPLDETDIKRLSSAFGMRMHPVLKVEKMHLGVDFLADMDKPVYATADGTIDKIQSSDPGEGYGNLVTIRHSNGISTNYAHLSGFNNIEEGQEVKMGDIIGFVGSSGKSNEPHLHYEVLVNNKRVNPADYF